MTDYKLIDDRERVTIVISVPRRWFLLVVAPAWLAFWVVVWNEFSNNVLQGESTLLAILWAAIFLYGAVATIVYTLYHVAGKEKIEATRSQLRIGREAFGIGRTKVYPVARIKDLHKTESREIMKFRPGPDYRETGPRDGILIFQIDSVSIRFAPGLDQAEAAEILTLLKQRFGYDVRIE